MMLMSRRMNLLLMGGARPGTLAIDSPAHPLNLMIVASLTAAAVASIDQVHHFHGVPHIMRRSAGPDHRRLLPVSALFGALLPCRYGSQDRSCSLRDPGRDHHRNTEVLLSHLLRVEGGVDGGSELTSTPLK